MSDFIVNNNYTVKFSAPSATDFVQLRSKVGWGELDINLAKVSLKSSLFHVSIYNENQLIGMGRVVGDGAMYFYIQDVIVTPSYQKQGVGVILMTHIEQYLQGTASKGATIGLLAAKGKEGFYSRYGYIERPNNALGNGMCKFI